MQKFSKKVTSSDYTDQFSRFPQLFTQEKNVLCIESRDSNRLEEALAALDSLGITANKSVITSDQNTLHFDDNSFDVVFTDSILHTDDLLLTCQEIERVLKPQGFAFLQINYLDTKHQIQDPNLDVVCLFEKSFCLRSDIVEDNSLGMNYEIVLLKTSQMIELVEDSGTINTVEVPETYQQLWDLINHNVQVDKAAQHGISPEETADILKSLSKRAYYLTTLAKKFNVKNIAEVGTAQGWQYYSFAEYCREAGGKVWSCDLRDVRHWETSKKYEDVSSFTLGDSKEMTAQIKEDNETIDMFYVDGSHDKGAIIYDVLNLIEVQSNRDCVWVFDDYDVRFGCYHDITGIARQCQFFTVHTPGKTASNNPTHQLVVIGKFKK